MTDAVASYIYVLRPDGTALYANQTVLDTPVSLGGRAERRPAHTGLSPRGFAKGPWPRRRSPASEIREFDARLRLINLAERRERLCELSVFPVPVHPLMSDDPWDIMRCREPLTFAGSERADKSPTK